MRGYQLGGTFVRFSHCYFLIIIPMVMCWYGVFGFVIGLQLRSRGALIMRQKLSTATVGLLQYTGVFLSVRLSLAHLPHDIRNS